MEYDVILVGGGLANGLLAYRLIQRQPSLKLLLLEQGPSLGGIHTWSFHGTDLSNEIFQWVQPLISASWKSHSLAFPRFSRVIMGSYHSIKATRFHEVISSALGDRCQLNAGVKSITPHSVTLNEGRNLKASCVVDGRGFSSVQPNRVGYQKFFGMELTLEDAHGLQEPTLMDVTCEQTDGFRFFYLLPWSENCLLIEDTHYSNTPDLDVTLYRREIHRYAHARGWKIRRESYEEQGALPIPLSEPFASTGHSWDEMALNQIPLIGVRLGLFHPTTGYSLPDAAQTAEHLSGLRRWSSSFVAEYLSEYAKRASKKRGFFRLLNRMLFQGASDEHRYRVLERFYRLPDALIARFYSMNLKASDYVRLLSGKPPIPVRRAVRCLWP